MSKHDDQIAILEDIQTNLQGAYQVFLEHLAATDLSPFERVTTKQWLKNIKKAAEALEITLVLPTNVADTERLFDV